MKRICVFTVFLSLLLSFVIFFYGTITTSAKIDSLNSEVNDLVTELMPQVEETWGTLFELLLYDNVRNERWTCGRDFSDNEEGLDVCIYANTYMPFLSLEEDNFSHCYTEVECDACQIMRLRQFLFENFLRLGLREVAFSKLSILEFQSLYWDYFREGILWLPG